MLFPRIECPIGLAVLCVQTIARVNIVLDFHRWRETWKGGKKNRIFPWKSWNLPGNEIENDFAGWVDCNPSLSEIRNVRRKWVGRFFPPILTIPSPSPPLKQKQICQSNFTRDCLPPAAATSASEWKWPTCVSLCELFQALKGNNENTKANVKGCRAGRPVFQFLIVSQFYTRAVVRKVLLYGP